MLVNSTGLESETEDLVSTFYPIAYHHSVIMDTLFPTNLGFPSYTMGQNSSHMLILRRGQKKQLSKSIHCSFPAQRVPSRNVSDYYCF